MPCVDFQILSYWKHKIPDLHTDAKKLFSLKTIFILKERIEEFLERARVAAWTSEEYQCLEEVLKLWLWIVWFDDKFGKMMKRYLMETKIDKTVKTDRFLWAQVPTTRQKREYEGMKLCN